jgi:hypothetical protein
MSLYPHDIINGIFGIIALLISFLVAIRIILKGFEYRNRDFILIGIAGFIVSEPWWGAIISFVLEISTGIGLTIEIQNLINLPLVPIGMFAWLVAFTDLVFKKHQKKIIPLFILYAIIYEIVLFIVYKIDPSLEVTFYGVKSRVIPTVFLVSFLIIIWISVAFFTRESLKSDDPEIQMKGKLLFVAILFYSVAALLETIGLIFSIPTISQIIGRTILILSAVIFYWGFFLPEWIKKRF